MPELSFTLYILWPPGFFNGSPGYIQMEIQFSCHLVDNKLLQVVQLVVPLIKGHVSRRTLATLIEFQHSRHLVNPSTDSVVQDAGDEETFNITRLDVQFPGDELDLDPRVRLDQFDQHLGSDIPEQVFYVLSDESILHDRLPVHFQDLLKLIDVVVLVCSDEVGHSYNLVVILVRLRLLRVKGVDPRFHQHVGKHQVFEACGSARRPRFIIILKSLKEVCVGFLKFSFAQVHFSSTLPDDSKDKGMGNSRLDVKTLVVQGLQLLVVLLCCVHLDFKGIHLQELGALLEIILPLLSLATLSQLLQDPGQPVELFPVKIKFSQFSHGLEPKSLVLGVPQSIQRCLIKVLQ